MFGPRISTVFASRWRALWWGASILIFAWSVVPNPDEQPVDQKPKPAHVDPWAVKKATQP
ncbi:hypothetical protein SAMN05660666_03312 [Novosphingobium aromaticivorans]|uniref:hypothetical protein n=1 Tax=Novosphingobium aromaticivorans TaxID=48935 RepID=UPI00003C7D18|nr:hypothetical protein [Novosphingobium aromaticivorans]SCY86721.1 hypothetical protein SAMN05660666_03312 [Novosphingobium aromaticivorans]